MKLHPRHRIGDYAITASRLCGFPTSPSEVEEGFPKRGRFSRWKKRGMFSSDTKKVWQLEEDRHIDIQKEYDPVSERDIYGFTREETRPEEAIQALKEIRRVLQQRLGTSDA